MHRRRPTKIESEFTHGVFRGGTGAFVPGLLFHSIGAIQRVRAFLLRRARWFIHRR
jgi:hypothetical protein